MENRNIYIALSLLGPIKNVNHFKFHITVDVHVEISEKSRAKFYEWEDSNQL